MVDAWRLVIDRDFNTGEEFVNLYKFLLNEKYGEAFYYNSYIHLRVSDTSDNLYKCFKHTQY